MTSAIEDKLLVLQMLGDDRAIDKTYVMGKSRRPAVTDRAITSTPLTKLH
jgi:hypothetical protein